MTPSAPASARAGRACAWSSSELRGEKIDIIPFNEEPARYVAKALSPARVREVLVEDEARQATVIVPDDQLSLAIGREGMNARLAARLTGWRIDIKSELTFAREEESDEFGDEMDAGVSRCAAMLRTGKRCPNAAVPATRYCALPAHSRLAGLEATLGRPLGPEEIEEASDGPGVRAALRAGAGRRGGDRGRRGGGGRPDRRTTTERPGHTPQRRCLGCGARREKPALARFVAAPRDGGHALARDDAARRGGPGALRVHAGASASSGRWPGAGSSGARGSTVS